MSYRRKLPLPVISIVLICGFLVSCDAAGRHKVLTFFFDGVPPLGAEPAPTEEEPVSAEAALPASARKGTEIRQVLFEHPPSKDCAVCHGASNLKSFSLQVSLVTPVPELCWRCHEDYTRQGGRVHGPVAVGDCLICHTPHRSEVEHLLQEEQPKLCYLCHRQEVVVLIPGHEELTADCSDCHEAHLSTAKSLLKMHPDQGSPQ